MNTDFEKYFTSVTNFKLICLFTSHKAFLLKCRKVSGEVVVC